MGYGAAGRTDILPISGAISICVPTRDGHAIHFATIGPEGAAGFEDGSGLPVLTRGIVQATGRFGTFRPRHFTPPRSSPTKLDGLGRSAMLGCSLQAQRTALCNAVHGAESRLCRWLLRTSDALGSQLILATQEEIADALGIRRTTANLIAHELVSMAAISCGRGKIAIRDRARLESAACECYSVLGRSYWPSELLRTSEPPQRIA